MTVAAYYFGPHLKRPLKVIKLMCMKIDWLETRLLSFIWSTSLICSERGRTAFLLWLCSAVCVKVRWDEIWILNFYWLVSPKTRAACLNEQVSREERKAKGAQGLREQSKTEKNLRSWECSTPCRRGICIHPSTPQQPSEHCALHSNLCRCCRASWCVRCGPLWHTAGLPYSLHTATPRPPQERENLIESNVYFHRNVCTELLRHLNIDIFEGRSKTLLSCIKGQIFRIGVHLTWSRA